MINLENVTTNKTARIEEVLAYIICKDYIFKDMECAIGDKANLPDIYSKDYLVGLEVAVCETYETLKKIEGNFQGNLENLAKYFKKKKTFKYNKTSYLNEYFKQVNPSEEYFAKLNDILNNKLQHQEDNVYHKCKNNYLIILSCFEDKKYLNTQQLIETIKQKAGLFKNKYNGIFVSLGDKLLFFDKNLNSKILSDINLHKNKKDSEVNKI